MNAQNVIDNVRDPDNSAFVRGIKVKNTPRTYITQGMQIKNLLLEWQALPLEDLWS